MKYLIYLYQVVRWKWMTWKYGTACGVCHRPAIWFLPGDRKENLMPLALCQMHLHEFRQEVWEGMMAHVRQETA